ncbi:MAG TPA: carbonic anhydrase [Isosphaeraceae bacterium]|jgi:carbonic anhydrase|nr:carbonic anhydrase [Isosphaeraceae bacterium]
MKTIDYVYRFDPKNPSTKPPPADAEVARKNLEDGNRMFARWMASCQSSTFTMGEEPRYVVECNGLEVGMVRKQGGMPKQAPFAVVIGCSDARVPTEMIFGQGFNDLFVIRVAGNVLGDVCHGSVDFALEALTESVKVLVVLGHSGCGAVTGAVDAYLRPLKFWSKTTTPALRTILQKVFVSVREAANCLEEVWGTEARQMLGFRDALIETAVALNTAQAAFALRQEAELAGRWEIEVLYGVYNLFNHQVSMPNDPFAPPSDKNVRLALAPTNPRDFRSLGLQMAENLRSHKDRLHTPPWADTPPVAPEITMPADADGDLNAAHLER